MVAERWQEVYESVKTLPEFVTAEAEKHTDSYERNFTKWNTLGKKVFSEPAEIAALTTHKAHAEYLSNWLENRIAWFNTYFVSDNWKNGELLDENEKTIDPYNAVAVSTLMFWGGSGEIDPDSPRFTAQASNNMLGGGQALFTGLMLFKGQKYRLSFDYTATSTASINYRIQANHDNYTPYMNGSVNAAGTVQYFETEFTANTDDANCALVLEFKGSGTVKVEHLSLVALEKEKIVGDVNADGDFTVADVVALQKWLLAVPDVRLADWKAGDLCEDNRLDVFDLCMMKRELVIQ